jgi:hypothetical protein
VPSTPSDSAFRPGPSEKPSLGTGGATGPQSPVERRSRDFERLRGLQLLLENVAGAPIQELAKKYAPTEKGLSSEKQVQALEERLLAELGPLVMAVYESQLKLGNLDAARDIAISIGLIKRNGPGVAESTTTEPPKNAIGP